MNILIHARIRDLYEILRATLEAQEHRVDAAFSLDEGKEKMTRNAYDKVFIGIGVSNYDRLELMVLARELGMSMAEIIDADTVAKEISMHSPTGKHPCLTGAASAEPGAASAGMG